ncbi:protoheme IX farnesyltransferase [bacterium]|nr:protoheme IX farnesyltransferase [bacterium]
MTHVIAWKDVEEVAATPSSSLRDFWQLLKPRVMTLVVFCGAVGMWLAPGNLHPFRAFMVVLCIAMATGASGAYNMWYERRTDALMQRTKNRPIPGGRIQPDDALSFSIFLNLFSVMILGMVANWPAAFCLLAAILSYCWLYTMFLKPRTHQNIVIGGIAGALPPLIGWMAVTGEMALLPWLMVAIIFFWTPPHFWALSLYRHDDYKHAGIPMLPVVKGEITTRRYIMGYTLLLAVIATAPLYFRELGWVYLAACVPLNGWMLLAAWKLLRHGTPQNAMKLFGISILYLFGLFGAMVLDYAVGA